jgi:hypothetical protein
MADINGLSLLANQQQQIIDQYRTGIYTLELQQNLIIKMLEEKGIFAKEEFAKRWPLYLKNDIGVTGPDGQMDGILKISFYNNN